MLQLHLLQVHGFDFNKSISAFNSFIASINIGAIPWCLIDNIPSSFSLTSYGTIFCTSCAINPISSFIFSILSDFFQSNVTP